MEQDGLAIWQRIQQLKAERSRLDYEIFTLEQQFYNRPSLLAMQQTVTQFNETMKVSEPITRESTPEEKKAWDEIDKDSMAKLEPWPSNYNNMKL